MLRIINSFLSSNTIPVILIFFIIFFTFSPQPLSFLGLYCGTVSVDHSFRLWDVERGTQLLLQDGHAREVKGLSFQSDGSLAATCDMSGICRVWDLRTGRSISTLQVRMIMIETEWYGGIRVRMVFAARECLPCHRAVTMRVTRITVLSIRSFTHSRIGA